MEERNVDIITDEHGRKIVRINEIRFKGKRSIDWKEVEQYLKQYVGYFYEVIEYKDIVYIGSDLPDEYTGSRYTNKLRGALAKAKANAAQGIPEMIEIAGNRLYNENHDKRHYRNARHGWYRYQTRFELPVFREDGTVERYNLFTATLLIRIDHNGKLFLYDILGIKKEMSNPLSS